MKCLNKEKQSLSLLIIAELISTIVIVVMNMTPNLSGGGIAVLEFAILVVLLQRRARYIHFRKEVLLPAILLAMHNAWAFYNIWKSSSKVAGIASSVGVSSNIFLILWAVFGACISIPICITIFKFFGENIPEELVTRPYFDYSMTNRIKGIAILLMVAHHALTFPNYYISSDIITGPWVWFAKIFQAPFRICVPVFAFLTGYFYCFARDKSLKYSFKKIMMFLLTYWKIYIPFLVIAVLTCSYRPGVQDIVLEAFGLRRNIMIFCWYVPFYLVSMLLLPIVIRIFDKNRGLSIVCIFTFPILCFELYNCIQPQYKLLREIVFYIGDWFSVIYVGYLFAKEHVFSMVHSKMEKLHLSKGIRLGISVGLILFTMIIRNYCVYFTRAVRIDILLAPIFIFSTIEVITSVHSHYLNSLLEVFGKNSTLIWFSHCLFYGICREKTQPLLFFGGTEPIFVFIKCVVLSLGIALIINKIANITKRMMRFIWKK